MPFIDLTGQRFERLIALRQCDPPPHTTRKYTKWWLCLCDCGTEKPVNATHLRGGRIRSCGCLRQENLSTYPATHGQTGTPTWHSWRGMKDRCYRKTHSSWQRYGGNGIRVCDRWLGKKGFENFLADMGERPEGCTLERIDSNKDYCPENCKWDTPRNQRLNTNRTHWITFQDKTQCLSDWAIELGVSRDLIQRRLKAGWTVEQTLSTPPRRWDSQKHFFKPFPVVANNDHLDL